MVLAGVSNLCYNSRSVPEFLGDLEACPLTFFGLSFSLYKMELVMPVSSSHLMEKNIFISYEKVQKFILEKKKLLLAYAVSG